MLASALLSYTIVWRTAVGKTTDVRRGEDDPMNLIKRLGREENGQGLVEYTFVVMLMALVFWLGVRDTAVGDSLAKNWAKILDCVSSPFSGAA
jgi:Flp pilus assembly pilin Flp